MADSNLYLMHHGKKGQKHGVRNAEWYPIEAWKKHLRNIGKTYKVKKANKKRAENLKKANEARSRASELRKEKEDIIKKGDITRALERIDDFTNEELKTVRERNAAIIETTKAKTDAAISKMGTLADATGKVLSATSNGIGIYNNLARIANTFGDANLPIIGNSKNQNQKKEESKKNDSKNSNTSEKTSKQIDKEVDKRIKQINKLAKKNAEAIERANSKNKKEEPEKMSGTVEGEPQRFKNDEVKEPSKDKPVVDTSWRDISGSNVQRGEQYVNESLEKLDYPLLEKKNK